ncbi:RNA 2',3'-cyclic phosphodiesterase [bacterium DOLJORAL78_65_58]|nr:MAG: RNA 2',3'-cyclic phosphodiesterase [bacterium DOLZORAL124_64_63]PIE75845.1 MAG: RNA 2',3'-cyclic phosphodiesterase [bacterium DOLJORAL78_65_58]
MRAFLAVPCGDEFRACLSTGLDPLRDLRGLRWSPPKQFHLTLAFLGEWPENKIQGLQRALDGLTPPAAFDLEEAGWGAFPSLAAPRVLFLHWRQDAALRNLAAAVRQEARSYWPESPMDRKPFRGHLTVARARRLDDGAIRRLGRFALPALPAVRVEEFQLVRSVLSPRGAEHTVLSRYPL